MRSNCARLHRKLKSLCRVAATTSLLPLHAFHFLSIWNLLTTSVDEGDVYSSENNHLSFSLSFRHCVPLIGEAIVMHLEHLHFMSALVDL